jgi:MFS family permease
MRGLFDRTIDLARGFPGVLWVLGLAAFINMCGLSFLWPVNSIYIHSVLHKPLTDAGLVLMVWAGTGFIGSFIGGWLCDRIGPTRVLGVALGVASAVIMVPVFTSGWWSYIAVMALFGTACAVPSPVLYTLVGHASPEGGRRGYNFIYVATNLGVAVGTALGGVLAEWSFRAVFIGIAVSYFVFFLLVLSVFRSRFAQVHGTMKMAAQVTEDVRTVALSAVPWIPILILFIGIVMVWSVYVQWMCTIPVYMQALGYPLSAYSLLWTLNGLLVFTLQPLVVMVVRKFPSLSLHISGGVLLYAGAFAIVALGHSYPSFVVGMVIMTVGELFAWPAIPAAMEQMAPASMLGMLQGMMASAGTLGRMVGPVTGGYLYDHESVAVMLWLFVTGGLAAFLFFLWFHRIYSRHQQERMGARQVGVEQSQFG